MEVCGVDDNIGSVECKYSLAGLVSIFLANYYPMEVVGAEGEATAGEGVIKYTEDAKGKVTKITLPTGQKFYKLTAVEGTGSFSDTLLSGGNGGKYRQHTVNSTVTDDGDALNGQADALSLGKFIAVTVSKDGSIRVLGRTSGLSAPAGGADLNSGAQEADATGWTLIQQGTSTEVAPSVVSLSALDIKPPATITD